MSEPHTDIVLGAAQGYGWPQLRPFVESLRATGYDGEVRLFVSDVDGETVGMLEARGVAVTRPPRLRARIRGRTFQLYNPKLTRLRWHGQPLLRHVIRSLALAAPSRGRAERRLTAAISNVDVARYFWYLEHLERAPGRYRNVMLSDVRDVIFLGPPFDFDIGDAVHVFLEDGRFSIGDQVNNRGWLHGAYGAGAVAELANRPIVCSGITIGAAAPVAAYLRVMTEHLGRLPRQFVGMDQGVHNYVLHTGQVAGARLVANGDGPVLTVGLMEADAAVECLREHESRISIVHQYDRHAAVGEALARLRPAAAATLG